MNGRSAGQQPYYHDRGYSDEGYDQGYDQGYEPPPRQRYDSMRPDPYMNGNGHPAGQRQYQSDRGSSDNGYGHPHAGGYPSEKQQQPYFDPPPREPYDEQHYASYERPPHDDYPEYDTRGETSRERPYAPNDPGPHEYNQVTPFDEEKADAEWRRGVEDAYSHHPPPPPPQDPEYLRQKALEDEAREREIEREREVERQRRYEDERYYEERERERERIERRRRREKDSMRERLTGYPSDPKRGGRDVFGGSEKERGLGGKIAGGAGGALIGHELSDNILGTLGGAVVGAVAANFIEKHAEKNKQVKVVKRRSLDDGYPGSASRVDPEYPRRRDDYRDLPDRRDPSRYERGRERSASRGGGIKERIARSLSRFRSKSRGPPPTRRRDSYDSEDSYRR